MAFSARTGVLILSGVSLLFWLVTLGGLGAVTNRCNSLTTAYHCAQGLQYEWWGLSLCLFLTLALGVIAYRGGLHRHRLTLMAFVVLSNAVLMQNISSYMFESAFVNTIGGDLRNANNAAAAGCVIITISQWLALIILGDMDNAANSDLAAWQAGAKDAPMSADA